MNPCALCSLNSLLRATAVPNPCGLVTAAEMQVIVGKLSGMPKATDPASGEVTCTFEPVNGRSFIDVSLHDGDLKAWKARNGGKTPVSLPELGAGRDVLPSRVAADGRHVPMPAFARIVLTLPRRGPARETQDTACGGSAIGPAIAVGGSVWSLTPFCEPGRWADVSAGPMLRG
jgi:hypothetical protein